MGHAAIDLAREERHDHRLQTRAQVAVSIDLSSEHNFWSGITMNMSEGGVFVATHRIVPNGTILTVEMELPNEEEPIMALAEVRWSRAYTGDPDAPPGLGLQFSELDARSLERIRSFVEKIREPLFFDAD
jgi:uncharacterized protein (TIGR02266 family)